MAEAALFIGWGEPARGCEMLANRDICVHTMTAPPISAPSYALAAQIRRAVNGMWEDSGPDLRHETVRPVEPPNLFRVIKAGSQAAGSKASPYTIEAMHPTAFSLSNWEAIKANDFGRVFDGPCNELPQGPCGWTAWDLRAQSTVIQPTMDVYNAAKDRGAAIFFITGRDETQRAATERNLQVVGYTDYAQLIMEPPGAHYVSAADFKAPQREQIARRGYTIIANVGDQPSDLDGGFAEQTYLLPNPFYRIP